METLKSLFDKHSGVLTSRRVTFRSQYTCPRSEFHRDLRQERVPMDDDQTKQLNTSAEKDIPDWVKEIELRLPKEFISKEIDDDAS